MFDDEVAERSDTVCDIHARRSGAERACGPEAIDMVIEPEFEWVTTLPVLSSTDTATFGMLPASRTWAERRRREGNLAGRPDNRECEVSGAAVAVIRVVG